MPPFTERKFIIKMLKKIQKFCFSFHAYYEVQSQEVFLREIKVNEMSNHSQIWSFFKK